MSDGSGRELPDPSLSKVRGRLQRKAVPRATLAALAPRPAGLDAVGILEGQDAGRVSALVPLRYERMARDELGFLRGAAAVMAADLAASTSTDLWVQLCGDAHLSNFGVFRTPEGRVVFDVNDFDETRPGPFEWDVKRLAASVAVAADVLGLSATQQRRALLETTAQYRTAMRRFAKLSTLEVWNARLEVGRLLARLAGAMADEYADRAERTLLGERRKEGPSAYVRLVEHTTAGPRIRAHPPLVVPVRDLPPADGGEDTYRFLVDVLRGYESSLSLERRHLLRQFTPVDAARKVVGVGSVGLRCFAVLLCGRDESDLFVLQVKEAVASVLEAHLGPSSAATHGQRVAEGQELIQATPDPLLGWLDVPDDSGAPRSYYVRQLYDGKASADLTRFDASLLRGYGALCGWTLAHAHARSGDRLALASYLGKSERFDEAVADFATAYVERNREDHASLCRAVKEGRLPGGGPR